MMSSRTETISEYRRLSIETLSEKVYQYIEELIVSNRLLPGQILSIDGLAKNFGVSTTPVREAIAALISAGLIERESHKHIRVSEIKEDDVRQAYEARRLLEPYAASLSAKKACTDSALRNRLHDVKQEAERLEQIARTAPLTPFQYDTYVKIDLLLHDIILDTFRDTLLGNLLRLVGSRSLRLRSFCEASAAIPDMTVIRKINSEHIAIIKAMLDGDQEGLQKAIRDHLDGAEDRTLNALKKQARDTTPEGEPGHRSQASLSDRGGEVSGRASTATGASICI
jgi:DNA-binding GntR family transcriptional regulator